MRHIAGALDVAEDFALSDFLKVGADMLLTQVCNFQRQFPSGFFKVDRIGQKRSLCILLRSCGTKEKQVVTLL